MAQNRNMVVTLVLSGVPRLVPLTDLAIHIDNFLKTDEVGSFIARDLPNHYRTGKRQIALDFKDGFNAMAAQDLLNGYKYLLPNDREYTISALVTHDPTLMPLSPKRFSNELVQYSSRPSTSEQVFEDQLLLLKKRLKVVETETEILKAEKKRKKAKKRLRKYSESGSESDYKRKGKKKHKRKKRRRRNSSSSSSSLTAPPPPSPPYSPRLIKEETSMKPSRKRSESSHDLSPSRKHRRVSPSPDIRRSRSKEEHQRSASITTAIVPYLSSNSDQIEKKDSVRYLKTPPKTHFSKRTDQYSDDCKTPPLLEKQSKKISKKSKYKESLKFENKRPEKSEEKETRYLYKKSSERISFKKSRESLERYNSFSPEGHRYKDSRYKSPRKDSRCYYRSSKRPRSPTASSSRYDSRERSHDRYKTEHRRYDSQERSRSRHRSPQPTHSWYDSPRRSRSRRRSPRRSPNSPPSRKMRSRSPRKHSREIGYKDFYRDPYEDAFRGITYKRRPSDQEVVYLRREKSRYDRPTATVTEIEEEEEGEILDDMDDILQPVDGLIEEDEEDQDASPERINVTLRVVKKKNEENTKQKTKDPSIRKSMPKPIVDTNNIKQEYYDISEIIKVEVEDDPFTQPEKKISKNPKFVMAVSKTIKKMNSHIKTVEEDIRDKFLGIMRKILRLRIKDLLQGVTYYMPTAAIIELYREHFDASEDADLVQSVLGDMKEGKFDDFVASDDEEEPSKEKKVSEDPQIFASYIAGKKKKNTVDPENKENNENNHNIKHSDDVVIVEKNLDVIDISDNEESKIKKEAGLASEPAQIHLEVIDIDSDEEGIVDNTDVRVKAENNKTSEGIIETNLTNLKTEIEENTSKAARVNEKGITQTNAAHIKTEVEENTSEPAREFENVIKHTNAAHIKTEIEDNRSELARESEEVIIHTNAAYIKTEIEDNRSEAARESEEVFTACIKTEVEEYRSDPAMEFEEEIIQTNAAYIRTDLEENRSEVARESEEGIIQQNAKTMTKKSATPVQLNTKEDQIRNEILRLSNEKIFSKPKPTTDTAKETKTHTKETEPSNSVQNKDIQEQDTDTEKDKIKSKDSDVKSKTLKKVRTDTAKQTDKTKSTAKQTDKTKSGTDATRKQSKLGAIKAHSSNENPKIVLVDNAVKAEIPDPEESLESIEQYVDLVTKVIDVD